MRFISAFTFTVFFFSCGAQNDVLSYKQFAEKYVDTLSKHYQSVKFVLNPDLTIISKKGEKEHTHYLDNAFTAYKAAPDSINSIIGRYVAATEELYGNRKSHI